MCKELETLSLKNCIFIKKYNCFISGKAFVTVPFLREQRAATEKLDFQYLKKSFIEVCPATKNEFVHAGFSDYVMTPPIVPVDLNSNVNEIINV